MAKDNTPIQFPAGFGPGRPILVRLSAGHIEVATLIGDGITTKGIRRIIERYIALDPALRERDAERQRYLASHPELLKFEE
jgi:hypothetical protein